MFTWWSSLETVSLLSTIARWLIALMGVFVLILGTRQALLQKKADARKRSEVDRQINEAQQRVEAQQEEFEQLKAATAPREISDAQKSVLKNALSKLPPRGIIVASFAMDPESGDYGSQISAALQECGWQAELRKSSLNDFRGIGISCVTAKGQPLPGYGELISAFQSAQITMEPMRPRDKSIGGKLPEGSILILVGRK